MFYQTTYANFFIGDKSYPISKKNLNQYTAKSILKMPPFNEINKKLSIKECYFQNQVHGTQGAVVTKGKLIQHFDNVSILNNQDILLNHDGDFLVTNLPNIALGVLTADCLPIIMIDNNNHTIGIAHAGWRGSVKNIGTQMLKTLHYTYGTKQKDIMVYFGPSARNCCYEINTEFLQNLDPLLSKKTVNKDHDKIYFDLPTYNKLLLQSAGITEKQFCLTYNICTICNTNHFSFRREKEDDLRQITLVSLK